MPDLNQLLGQLDPQAPLARRHLWLLDLLQWVRGDGAPGADAAASRVVLLLDALDADPVATQRLRDWWRTLSETVDISTLLADFGFAPRTSFASDLALRLRLKLLPGTPETHDAAELFGLALSEPQDAQWIAALDARTLERLGALLSMSSPLPGLSWWQDMLLEAITFCASQVRAAGFSAELRQRMSAPARETQPFHDLAADVADFRAAFLATPREPQQIEAAAQRLRERLDACRQAAYSAYSHLEENGISVGLVFMLRQLRARVLRVRELMDCLLGGAGADSARLLGRLVTLGQERRSLRALVAANTSLLAAKVAERSAETGEHYITRNRDEYRAMLRKAAGGGAFMTLTTAMKFVVLALGFSAFWTGFWAGMNYALSFVAIQLLHWTVATKQPAMTAPAMASKLNDVRSPEAVASFVDEVAHLVRSQVAAIIGNLALVAPCVMLVSGALLLASGQPMIDRAHAEHVLHDLTLLGPTALFAAFTGVLLFASSIVAGWAENWFVLHRLDSALRYNPRITRALGPGRADRWARFMRENISGFAANISLGLMLGLVPAFATFFGLSLEVRHVTLSTGQLAAAAATLGREALSTPGFWWCLAALPVTGALNVCVSFYFAFRLALAAHNVSGMDRSRIYQAIRARVRQRPASFFLP